MTRRMAKAGLLAMVLVLAAPTAGRADDAGKPALSAAGTMAEALAKLGDGRDVEIVLGNGKSYRGKLGTVGKDTVLVTQIVGKEFFDVLIDLDAVAAVEVRARNN